VPCSPRSNATRSEPNSFVFHPIHGTFQVVHPQANVIEWRNVDLDGIYIIYIYIVVGRKQEMSLLWLQIDSRNTSSPAHDAYLGTLVLVDWHHEIDFYFKRRWSYFENVFLDIFLFQSFGSRSLKSENILPQGIQRRFFFASNGYLLNAQNLKGTRRRRRGQPADSTIHQRTARKCGRESKGGCKHDFRLLGGYYGYCLCTRLVIIRICWDCDLMLPYGSVEASHLMAGFAKSVLGRWSQIYAIRT
jgi:hypothetical protein